jgi:nucleoid DNA-binding protein
MSRFLPSETTGTSTSIPGLFLTGRIYFQASSNKQRKALSLIKQDLIQRVVERTGLPRIKAESAVDAIFEAMKGALTNSDRIELRGFGVFTVKPRKTGVGRNPRTGAEVSITPGKAVRFKPGKDLQLID